MTLSSQAQCHTQKQEPAPPEKNRRESGTRHAPCSPLEQTHTSGPLLSLYTAYTLLTHHPV